MFQVENLNEFDAMVRPYINGWIPRHPLRVNNAIYKPLPALVEPRGEFGMTPLFDRMKRKIHDAVQSVQLVDAIGGGAGEIDVALNDRILSDAGAALENGDDEEADILKNALNNLIVV